MLVAQLTERILLPRRSARLELSSMPAERRLLAMRRVRWAPLGQRVERRMPSLTMLFKRTSSSAVLPPKALSSQLAKRLVERRGFQREVARIGTISLVDLEKLAAMQS